MATRRAITLHGHPMAYDEVEAASRRAAGPDPEVVVLLHGVAGSASTWRPVLDHLADDGRRHVIAPDLLGHGESAGPSGDFSMGAYANGLRDLLAALGHRRVTVVGHSLGGGVAMQFAYQFPEMTARLVLVSSGGLGRGVSSTLRLASLPGAGVVLPALARSGALGLGVRALRMAAATLPLRPADAVSLVEYSRHVGSLTERAHADAFVDTIRGVIGPWGQRVSGTDRLYLTEGLPTMVVWGRRDPIIPVGHAYRASSLMPGSELEVFDGSGHFPHCDEPSRFAALLTHFCDTHAPADLDAGEIGPRLASGGAVAG